MVSGFHRTIALCWQMISRMSYSSSAPNVTGQQFHTPKNLAISLSLEAGEVLELFQWEDRQGEALEKVMPRLRDEVADVAVYLTLLVHGFGD